MKNKTLNIIPKIGWFFALFLALIVVGGCKSKHSLNLFSGDPTPAEFLTRDAAYYKEVKISTQEDVLKILKATGKEISINPLENCTIGLYACNDFSWGHAKIEFDLQEFTVVKILYKVTIQDNMDGTKKLGIIKETKEKLSRVTGSDPKNTNVIGAPGWDYADLRDNVFFCIFHKDDYWFGAPESTITVSISFSQKSGQQTPQQKSSPKNIFTVVYADSDDGFVNVRSKPSASGEILEKLYGAFHGLGDGVLVEKGASWSKVSVHGVTGWCNNRYLGYITWYEGNGRSALVSKKDNTPIYGDDLSGEERYPIFARIPKDVTIADKYVREGNYYVLMTGGDALRVSISDVYVR